MVPTIAGLAFFPLALGALWAYRIHARRSPAPLLDLSLFRIKTFHIGTVTGGLCRMGLDATPFLLPLLFQVGFGLSPLQAGLLSFSSTFGAMFVRTFSRLLLRVLGFRRTLVGGAFLSAAVTASYALWSADTPYWIIVVVVLLSGCIRSIQYRHPLGDAQPRHQRQRRRAAGGARLRRRDRRRAPRNHRRRPTGDDRRFPHRFPAGRADPAHVGLRFSAPRRRRRRRSQRPPRPGRCGKGGVGSKPFFIRSAYSRSSISWIYDERLRQSMPGLSPPLAELTGGELWLRRFGSEFSVMFDPS
jgi:hypothetical protein